MRPVKSESQCKTESVIVRVTKKMKRHLEKLAEYDRRELSDYIRIKFEDIIKSNP